MNVQSEWFCSSKKTSLSKQIPAIPGVSGFGETIEQNHGRVLYPVQGRGNLRSIFLVQGWPAKQRLNLIREKVEIAPGGEFNAF
jgi:hypothetical protein